MVSNVLALIMLAFGLLLLLWGFRYGRILMPVISFVIGFTAAAGAVALISEEGFLSTPPGWIAALLAGVIYALLAVRFTAVGLILLAGTLGYGLFAYLLLAVDIDNSTIIAVGGLLGAVIFVLFTIFNRDKKWLFVALTAAAGAISSLIGVLLLFDKLSLNVFTLGGTANTLLENPLLWPTVALVLTIVGYVAQSRIEVSEP